MALKLLCTVPSTLSLLFIIIISSSGTNSSSSSGRGSISSSTITTTFTTAFAIIINASRRPHFMDLVIISFVLLKVLGNSKRF